MARQVDESTDHVLFKSPEGRRPNMKCWAPENLHSLQVDEDSLQVDEDSYMGFETIARTVHLDDFKEVMTNNKIIQCPITENSHLRLSKSWLMVAWFGLPADGHNWYGNASFVVDFNSFLKEFKDFKKYFVEVAEYQTQNASRLLFSSKDYDDLREYDPTIRGGPWYMDSDNKHWALTRARGYKSRFPLVNGHALEFMVELDEDEAKKLFLMSAKRPADHSEANDPGYMKCKKHRSGGKWRDCPSPYSPEDTIDKLDEWQAHSGIQWAWG